MWITYVFLTSLITSILGALKNFIKYKQLELGLFFRTPIICVLIGSFIKFCFPLLFCFDMFDAFFVLILERWLMLIYKTVVVYTSSNYMKKKINTLSNME